MDATVYQQDHRDFVCLIGSDEGSAEEMLDSIKVELETNDLLEEDFSEVCGPIRALEGIHQRAAGQLYNDSKTHIGWRGRSTAGLERLTERAVGKEWRREDGAMMRIGRYLIDANWRQSTDVVYQFCRQSQYAGVVVPSHGRYVGASSIPFAEYKRKRGERVGLNWRIPVIAGKRAVRHVVFDTNYWKSFIHARLAVPMGDPGCLSLYGRKPEAHRLLSEHLTAEYRVRTEGRGRTVDEWKLRAENGDNHWLDGIMGCAVGASMGGTGLLEAERKPIKPRIPYSQQLAEWQAGR